MAQADAEQGHLAQQLFDLLDLIGVLRRVSGAVGEHDAIGISRQNVLGAGIRRQDGDGASPPLELPDDVPLGAVVQQADAEPLLPLRRVDSGLFAGDSLHHAGDGIGLDRRQVRRNLIADHRVHNAVLPDDAGQLPGVHPPEAGDALGLQKAVQIPLAAEVGGRVAPLPHHIAPDAAGPLEILGDDAVVADQRIRLHDDLPRVAGIRQRLDVAAHAGGEHQLPHGVLLAPEPKALKHLAVLQYQIPFSHAFLPSRSLARKNPY